MGWFALGSSGLGVGKKHQGLKASLHLVQGMKTSDSVKHSAATPARGKYVGNAFHVVAALLASQLTRRAQRDTHADSPLCWADCPEGMPRNATPPPWRRCRRHRRRPTSSVCSSASDFTVGSGPHAGKRSRTPRTTASFCAGSFLPRGPCNVIARRLLPRF